MFFVLKSLALTFLLVILLQVKVGPLTLEEQTMNWLSSSPLITPLQDVAEGGVKIVRDFTTRIFGGINTSFFERVEKSQVPGQRELSIGLQRSEEYLRDQARRLEQRFDDVQADRNQITNREGGSYQRPSTED